MSKLKLIIGFLVIVLLLGVAVYFLLLPKKEKKEAMHLKIGFMEIVDCLALFVAQEKGLFQEEGLEMEAIPMAGGAVIGPAIDAGDLDIGWSNVVSMAISHEKGLDYKFLTAGAFKDPKSANLFQLITRSDSLIQKPKNLEGKTVAINTFKNIMELALRTWTEKNNVAYDKLNVVEVPFPQMESALENKEIDVAFLIEPYITLSINSGVGKVLDDRPYDAVAERLMIASWFTKKSWADKNPNRVKAFIKAIEKAHRYILEHPAEMPEIISKYTRLPKELASQITISTFFESILKQDIQVIIDLCEEYGYIKEKFDAKEIVIEELELK